MIASRVLLILTALGTPPPLIAAMVRPSAPTARIVLMTKTEPHRPPARLSSTLEAVLNYAGTLQACHHDIPICDPMPEPRLAVNYRNQPPHYLTPHRWKERDYG